MMISTKPALWVVEGQQAFSFSSLSFPALSYQSYGEGTKTIILDRRHCSDGQKEEKKSEVVREYRGKGKVKLTKLGISSPDSSFWSAGKGNNDNKEPLDTTVTS